MKTDILLFFSSQGKTVMKHERPDCLLRINVAMYRQIYSSLKLCGFKECMLLTISDLFIDVAQNVINMCRKLLYCSKITSNYSSFNIISLLKQRLGVKNSNIDQIKLKENGVKSTTLNQRLSNRWIGARVRDLTVSIMKVFYSFSFIHGITNHQLLKFLRPFKGI